MPLVAPASHYVRFVRALAFTSGALIAATGCSSTVGPADGDTADAMVRSDAPGSDGGADIATPPVDVSTPPVDVAADTTTPPADTGCSACDCRGNGPDVGPGPRPYCEDIGLGVCCAAIGPLAPPELGA